MPNINAISSHSTQSMLVRQLELSLPATGNTAKLSAQKKQDVLQLAVALSAMDLTGIVEEEALGRIVIGLGFLKTESTRMSCLAQFYNNVGIPEQAVLALKKPFCNFVRDLIERSSVREVAMGWEKLSTNKQRAFLSGALKGLIRHLNLQELSIKFVSEIPFAGGEYSNGAYCNNVIYLKNTACVKFGAVLATLFHEAIHHAQWHSPDRAYDLISRNLCKGNYLAPNGDFAFYQKQPAELHAAIAAKVLKAMLLHCLSCGISPSVAFDLATDDLLCNSKRVGNITVERRKDRIIPGAAL